MANNKPYEIVYDSDFIISDPVELSTLCVFYDKVYLPSYHYPSLERDVRKSSNTGKETQGEILISKIGEWERDHKLFFDEDILKRYEADRYLANENKVLRKVIENGQLAGRLETLLHKLQQNSIKKGSTRIVDVRLAVGFLHHLTRDDIALPRLSTDSPKNVNRETFKTLLADRALRYVLPTLSELHPEYVLELRQKVADVREGFSMHLQKLTGGIDARVKGGEPYEDIKRYAQAVFETELEPDYVEFKKLLGAEKVSAGGPVLNLTGRAFKFCVGPWDEENFSELLKAAGVGADLIAKQSKELLTNKSQAFQFMHRIEEADVNRQC